MKRIYETIIVAFSMFSALPVPAVRWDEDNMRYLLAAFPLVGALIGCLEAVWIYAAVRFCAPKVLTAALVTAIPVLVTGGIHLDGYADVSDALSSFADAKKRREILEDPHIGAFAVIRFGIWLILSFGFAAGLRASGGQMLLFGCSFVVSRCLSALAVSILPLAKETGLAHTFRSYADRKKCVYLLTGELLTTAVIMMTGGGILGGGKCFAQAVLMLLFAGGQWLSLRKTAAEKFGGLSGDLNGWFLVKAEIWMLAVLSLTNLMM
jgi:adenosylcobinamide-GDP ribazoletransferase